MFQFIYKGRFDCIISKQEYETYVIKLYNDIKTRFNIKWSPKKFIVTFESDPNREKGIGGTTDYDRKTDIVYRMRLQLFGYPKKEQTFELMQEVFGYTLTHEMLHFFIPSVKDNSCWSEGITDFMTFWYTDKIEENLNRLTKKYKNIEDPIYKQHLYGYLSGFKKMTALYTENIGIIDDMKKLIKDFNNDDAKKKIYTTPDIISYNPKFKTFFIGKCNNHIPHELK